MADVSAPEARDPDADGTETTDSTAESSFRCSYCGRRFATPTLRSLHQGSSHTDELTEAEWATVVDAREAEADELRRLRIRMLIGLTICYFGLLLLYATV